MLLQALDIKQLENQKSRVRYCSVGRKAVSLPRQTHLYMKNILLSVLTSLLLSTGVYAQTCRLFTTGHALPSTLITDIIEDGDNYLWVATEFGLSRFDGTKFTTYQYDADNPHSL